MYKILEYGNSVKLIYKKIENVSSVSLGLTFGTISALYGLSHGIITQAQYSFLVATVIASAVIPTMIANFAFLPKHLLSRVAPKKQMGQIASEGGIDEE